MKTLLTSTALVAMMSTSAMANTLSSSTTVDHVGNTGTGGTPIDTVACTFVDTSDGTMTYAENRDTDGNPTGGGVWTLNDDATVKLLVRNGYGDATGAGGTSPFDYKYALSGISVQPADKNGDATPTYQGYVITADGSVEHEANVDYTETGIVIAYPGTGAPTVSRAFTSAGELITVSAAGDNLSGYYKLKIGGTATLPAADGVILDANTTYKVRHIVTCIQNGTAGQWENGVDTTPQS